MRQYVAYFKLRFIASLQYRVAAIAGILTQFAFGFIFVMIYIAFYQSNKSGAPMELNQVVTYLWLQQSFFSFLYLYYRDKEILTMIKNGDVAYELCRPGNLYIKWYIKIFSSKLAALTLKFAPILLVAIFLPEPYRMMLPPNLKVFFTFLLSIGFSLFLIPAFCALIHLLSFFLLDDRGIYTFVISFAEIFAGNAIPLPFFPDLLQKIANLLPFRYMTDLPFRIYTGHISLSAAFPQIIIQFFWTVIFVGIGFFMTKKALNRVVVQGG